MAKCAKTDKDEFHLIINLSELEMILEYMDYTSLYEACVSAKHGSIGEFYYSDDVVA